MGGKGVSVLRKLEKFEKARGFSTQLRLELPYLELTECGKEVTRDKGSGGSPSHPG